MSKVKKNIKNSQLFKKIFNLWLECTFCTNEDVIEKFIEDNEFNMSDVVIGLWNTDYKGPLFFCLTQNLIDRIHEWKITMSFDVEDPETLDIFELNQTFNLPEMSLDEMRLGCKVVIDRGAGIKTRWKGLDKEARDLFKSSDYQNFNKISGTCRVEISTAFPNKECYDLFLRLNILNKYESHLKK